MDPIPGTREENGLVELTEDVSASPLYNPDLAPTPIAKRTWGTLHIASLWIGMVICIPTYMLAAGLMQAGMTWSEALVTVLLGNLVVLVPMCLNAHAGTRYGVPLPLLLRSSFGVRGTHVPSVMRGLVACGWFGIQTWIGGQALYALAAVMWPGLKQAAPMGWIGINLWQLTAFLLFWAMNIYFIVAGMESIKWMETLSAPLLIAMGLALLGWGVIEGNGLGRILDQSDTFTEPTLQAHRFGDELITDVNPVQVDGKPRVTHYRLATSQEGLKDAPWVPLDRPLRICRIDLAGNVLFAEFRDAAGRTASSRAPIHKSRPASGSRFWLLFFPSLTAMVGFWATVSLNIPDFTRHAKSQRSQFLGQLIGLPPTMALFSFIGVAVTGAAVAIFPDILITEQAPWDPVQLLSRFDQPVVIFLSMLFLLVATLSTNIAANVVAPANALTNLFPKKISFKAGGVITGVIGILMMPWKLLETAGAYLFTWLIGYSALLGPIGGIMIADYFLVRRRRLNVPHLYKPDGEYRYCDGIHWKAVVILIVSILPNLPGFLVSAGFVAAERVPSFFMDLYTYAWFVGFGMAFGLYAALVRRSPAGSGAGTSPAASD